MRPVTPKDAYVREGDTLTLNCSLNYSEHTSRVLLPGWRKHKTDGKSAYEWIAINGTSVNDCCNVIGDKSKKEGNLVILKVTKESSGQWHCTHYALRSATANITVIDPPLATNQSSVCVKEGTKLRMNCEYVPGKPTLAALQWKIPGRDSFTEQNPLIINKVNPVKHSGVYVCKVYNTYFNGRQGESLSHTEVRVEYEPKVQTPPVQQVKQGDDTLLQCDAKAMPYVDTFQWITPSGSVVNGHTPMEVYLTGNTTQKTNEPLTVTYTSSCSNPASNITWFVNGLPLQEHHIIVNVTTITEESSCRSGFKTKEQIHMKLKADDNAGKIQCSAKNPHFYDADDPPFAVDEEFNKRTVVNTGENATLQCLVNGNPPHLHNAVPDAVTNIEIHMQAGVADVQWTAGYNGGDDQKFYVEYMKLPKGIKETTELIDDNELGEISVNISGLVEGSSYNITVVSENNIGENRSRALTIMVKERSCHCEPESSNDKTHEQVNYESIPLNETVTEDNEIISSSGDETSDTYADLEIGNMSQTYMKPGTLAFEFPRDRLHTTATLCTSAFHRIMKGIAWFIDGKDGPSDVAIKTESQQILSIGAICYRK
ncbi:protein turtle-like [Ptychodera flava]|uniref:protein turtle-like n=1 Tax=Ptychodera flava TaxID=63121 RepID=UPI00396A059B